MLGSLEPDTEMRWMFGHGIIIMAQCLWQERGREAAVESLSQPIRGWKVHISVSHESPNGWVLFLCSAPIPSRDGLGKDVPADKGALCRRSRTCRSWELEAVCSRQQGSKAASASWRGQWAAPLHIWRVCCCSGIAVVWNNYQADLYKTTSSRVESYQRESSQNPLAMGGISNLRQ